MLFRGQPASYSFLERQHSWGGEPGKIGHFQQGGCLGRTTLVYIELKYYTIVLIFITLVVVLL